MAWNYFLHAVLRCFALLLFLGWHTQIASVGCWLMWISTMNRLTAMNHSFDGQLTFVLLFARYLLCVCVCVCCNAISPSFMCCNHSSPTLSAGLPWGRAYSLDAFLLLRRNRDKSVSGSVDFAHADRVGESLDVATLTATRCSVCTDVAAGERFDAVAAKDYTCACCEFAEINNDVASHEHAAGSIPKNGMDSKSKEIRRPTGGHLQVLSDTSTQSMIHVSVITTCLIINVVIMYCMASWHKTSPVWPAGDGAMLAIQFEPLSRPFGVWLMQHQLGRMMLQLATQSTRTVLVSSILLLTPFRVMALIPLFGFHVGIATTLRLGELPYINLACLAAFTPGFIWTAVIRRIPVSFFFSNRFVTRFAASLRLLVCSSTSAQTVRGHRADESEPVKPLFVQIVCAALALTFTWFQLCNQGVDIVCGKSCTGLFILDLRSPLKFIAVPLRWGNGWKVFAPRPQLESFYVSIPGQLQKCHFNTLVADIDLLPVLLGRFEKPFKPLFRPAPAEFSRQVNHRWVRFFQTLELGAREAKKGSKYDPEATARSLCYIISLHFPILEHRPFNFFSPPPPPAPEHCVLDCCT